jgi:DNA-binding transcriptional LysR family regulator
LLVKTPSGMKPMDRALALIDPVRAVRRNVKRLISAREDFDPAKSLRRFVIAATDYMDLLVIPALVERIARYAPSVDIHVKRTEAPFPERELEYNDLDVVLGSEVILNPPGYMIVEKLFDDRMTCLVSRNHEKFLALLTAPTLFEGRSPEIDAMTLSYECA